MDLSLFEKLFLDQGFIKFSSTNLTTSISFEAYKAQIWNQNTGSMNYLKKHLEEKNPDTTKHYKSALLGLYPYYPAKNEIETSLKVALYARQKDYHYILGQNLRSIEQRLKDLFPQEDFKASIDSAPLLERDLAYKAGLGWIGKNTCLLNRESGSLFYIGEILTTLDFSNKPTLASDHCGTCIKCIEACPTDALKPHKMDVAKCISYRTIEDRDTSPESLHKKSHSWLFGCDICQTVCPWNEKAYGKEQMALELEKHVFTEQNLEELKMILSSSNKELEKRYSAYPLSRARAKGLKRNSLKIIYENKLSELKDFLKELKVPENLQDLKDQVLHSL